MSDKAFGTGAQNGFQAGVPQDVPKDVSKELTLDTLRTLPLTLDGVSFAGGTLAAFAESYARREGHLGDLARFLLDWRSQSPTTTVLTSGSTGAPKPISVEKTRMARSARLTCDFLRLQKGKRALLAMPLRYIAARMMVVRALVGGLDLVTVHPSASPLVEVMLPLDFAPLTAMQVYESLQDHACAKKLRQIRCLLVGGGAISTSLAHKLAEFPNEVWCSYGMTETLSHIALRRLNGPSASEWYTTLPGVSVRLSPEGTLAIWAPTVLDGELVTNDLAEIDEAGRFRILGRCDNVVNSGGIKIQLEAVEELLEPVIKHPFCVTSLPDQRLGEKLVLLHQGAESAEKLDRLCRRVLPKYWVPRVYLQASRIPLTETGKKARLAARELAQKLSHRH